MDVEYAEVSVHVSGGDLPAYDLECSFGAALASSGFGNAFRDDAFG